MRSNILGTLSSIICLKSILEWRSDRPGDDQRQETCEYGMSSHEGIDVHSTHITCLEFKSRKRAESNLGSLVGVTGFEPVAPCSQSRCATRLR